MAELRGTTQRFTSRWGLILSILGIAVGTGNIWRFPRIAAKMGGDDGAGAFLIAWIIFLFLWSIPLIIAEYGMGRKSRMGVVGAFGKVAGRKYAWMGGFVGFVAAAIMFYYSVVAGWCIFYLFHTAGRALPLDPQTALQTWEAFQASSWPLVFHASAMGVGGLICLRGISSIEKANKILVPTLLIIVLISVSRALTLPGAWAGVAYLFTPQWSQLADPNLWLEALTQNAWDTGAGWGLILTYAAYMRTQDGVVKNAFITGLGNNTVSLLAALMVFGTVFAVLGAEMQRGEILEVMKTSGPASTGLTFIWMPVLFAKMPLGKLLAVLFFLGLTFAALSSLISMIELATRAFVDAGVARKRAIPGVAVAGFVLGIPSALYLDFFANQDFVWGVALMISGAFVAFAVIRYGVQAFSTEITEGAVGDWQLGGVWRTIISVLVPVQALILLIWWMTLSATTYAPDRWYDPLDPFSVMSCLVQWGAVLVLLIVFNRTIARRTLGDA